VCKQMARGDRAGCQRHLGRAKERGGGVMVRVLRDLRIDEVSAVDRGAGHGTRIKLRKRDGAVGTQAELAEFAISRQCQIVDAINASDLSAAEKKAEIAKSFTQLGEWLRAVTERDDKADDGIPEDLVTRVVQMHGGAISRAQALEWLLSHPTGREVWHLQKQEKAMDRETELQSVVKRAGGFMPLIKTFSEDGTTCGISEAELTR